MVIERNDPTIEVLERGLAIQKRDPEAPAVIDAQELAERQEATDRYLGENEQHFVDYCMGCVKESIESNADIRAIWAECWHVYNEWEPKSYADKEPWQSRLVVPKPFQTVQFAAAAVEKAFSPNYLSIANASSEAAGKFWKKLLDHQLGVIAANFVGAFSKATVMGYAVGQSLEMIPRWVPGRGLQFAGVEPWKIHRDPDASSENPQSGLYWIHQEWLDYFVLQQGQDNGRYFDVARVKNVTADPHGGDPLLSKEAVAARKQQLWQRSNYRTMVLTSEFFGTVLSPRGEVLLPQAVYTVAGQRVIQAPTPVPYRQLRWPGNAFSPLPNLLRFGGRGLLEGVLTMWDAINNIMCLHMDALKWIVNPPKEFNVDALVDPEDVDDHPGKKYLTRDTMAGQQAVRAVEHRGRTNEVLANLQYMDQNYQRGSFVSDGIQGLPGYRKDMTFRESAMNLDQAMGVFGLMGKHLEAGAVAIIEAAADVIESNVGYHDLLEIFEPDELAHLGVMPDENAARGVTGIPPLTGKCHVSGMQALMRDAETLKTIREVVIPLANTPRFGPYVKPYAVIKAIESRVNLTDEGVFADVKEAQLIDMQQRLSGAKQNEAAEALARLQEVLGITELVERLQKIDAEDIRQAGEEIKLMEQAYGTGREDRSGDAGAADAPGEPVPAGAGQS
jgi:hypothetical protein